MTTKQSVPPASVQDAENQSTVTLKVKDLEAIADHADGVNRNLAWATLRAITLLAIAVADTDFSEATPEAHADALDNGLRIIADLSNLAGMTDAHMDIRRLLYRTEQQATTQPAPSALASQAWTEHAAGDILRQSYEQEKKQ